MRAGLLLLCLGVCVAACTPQVEPSVVVAPEAVPEGRVVTEWRPKSIPWDGVPRAVGESCVEGGHTSCESGRCVHAPGAELGQGYFCTRACIETAECPAGWPCVMLDAHTREGLCQPVLASGASRDGRKG